jgi:ribose 5-phosphate isomerase B
MAEYLLKAALKGVGMGNDFTIRSAGIMAENGSPASALAIKAMEEINPDIARHVSQRITQRLLNSAVAIFCLTEEHRKFLLSNFQRVRGRCFLVKEFTQNGRRDIPDPFFGSLEDYEHIRDEIASAMDSIVKFLSNHRRQGALRISIGNDHGGHGLAMFLIKKLNGRRSNAANILYYGAFSGSEAVDYADYAKRVTADVSSNRSKFGILLCRSGVGMCIAANKVRGIRAANCWNCDVARRAREHNDANILCLGADFVGEREALAVVNAFLTTKFSEGHHVARVNKVTDLEN